LVQDEAQDATLCDNKTPAHSASMGGYEMGRRHGLSQHKQMPATVGDLVSLK